jgi:Uma2 family endonuclease
MSLTTSATDVETGAIRSPITVAEWDVLVASGVLEGQRVQLIDGEKIEMVPEFLPHVQSLGAVVDQLAEQVGVSRLRVQHPLRCTTSPGAPGNDPEPDVAVTRETRGASLGRRVRAEDAELVVEVSQATRRYDLGPKAAVYARAGVPEYWVADLVQEVVVRHLEPGADGYRIIESVDLDDVVRSLAGWEVRLGRGVLRVDED